MFLNEKKSKKKTLTISPICNSEVQEAVQEIVQVLFLKKEKNMFVFDEKRLFKNKKNFFLIKNSDSISHMTNTKTAVTDAITSVNLALFYQ